MSIEIAIFLAIASGFAGFVDAMAGGGGLIQLPALLVAMPKTPPAELLGTNKLPSFLGTASATASYLRKMRPDFRIAFSMAVPAFIGSALGATVATLIPKDAFRPIILFALVAVFIYTLWKKGLGLSDNKKAKTLKTYLIAMLFGLS